jgi:2-phosphosulfolactate phosphatase
VRIDVAFTGGNLLPADLAGRVAVVVDVLRASTTIAKALAAGARTIIPCESAEEAIARAKAFERRDVLLAGERRMVAIPGFDLGNSPAEYQPEVVAGKTVLLTTTNGTKALLNSQGAREVLVGCYANYSAVLAVLRKLARAGSDVLIVCAGRERQFALEDAACAGRFVRGISRRGIRAELGDGARAATLLDRRYGSDIGKLLRDCEHGRALLELGMGADIEACAALNAYPVVPVYRDKQVVRRNSA